ncbi:MAG: hypothetical protein IRZ16_16010 [Myxococcaceae bacterium]|nr:hypothetical protein [Myxococcaceae bacterium]
MSGCGSRRSDFVQARVEDTCDESWPVCDTISGCILGAETYRSGRFPGEGRFAVRLAEPSEVTVSFFLEDVVSSGEQTSITFYEDGCRGRVREEIQGRTFVGEAERFTAVSRSARLTGVGDHLIEYASDAQADYLVKVDVVPVRTLHED